MSATDSTAAVQKAFCSEFYLFLFITKREKQKKTLNSLLMPICVGFDEKKLQPSHSEDLIKKIVNQ